MPDDQVSDSGSPQSDEPGDGGKHLTEQLGGRPGGPLSEVERTERERVRHLVQSVASCYHTLFSAEIDPARKAELGMQRARHDAEFRRRTAMSAEERGEILRTYPELLRRLRAEIDG